NMWRQVFETELFPGKTPPNGQQVVLQTLDLGFYPDQRGPYNYDVKGSAYSSGINFDGSLKDPRKRWGGIMRRLETNDFQAANIEYIQFWMMDPYNEDYNSETDSAFNASLPPSGDLYINLGNISEDILRDGAMSYENGIPGASANSQNLAITKTALADVPTQPPIINAFSADNNDRPLQDVGYDGLSDANEQERFKSAIDEMNAGSYAESVKAAFRNDPSTDNYRFFRDDGYDSEEANTLKRYSRYNNSEGNTPTEAQYSSQNAGGYSTISNVNIPNIEDINRDNTLSTVENFYQYHIRINPRDIHPSQVGTNFIVDAFDGTAEFSGVTKTVKWYQFKIPISQFEDNIGGIEGFNSIRFMRVYMRGFDRPVLLRLARFELVRADWRRYQFDLRKPGENIVEDDNSTAFDISAVSLQENSTKVPVNYVMPPDIQQQQNIQTTNLVLLNEQALQMRVCNLKDGDSRAIFKNVDLDTRMYQNIKMNVHAERLNDIPLNDGDLTLFFRVGTDYNNNFYEYEVPLKLTPKGVYSPNGSEDRRVVWPLENEINFSFAEITGVKQARNEKYGYFSQLNQLTTPFQMDMGGYTVTIVGNPNLGTVKSIMVGIRNPRNDDVTHCAEVWINELRLTDFNNKGGWAATGQAQAKLADLGLVSVAGTYKSPFWGSVESKINDRSRETNSTWDVSTSLNMGKFFPDKWKVTLPMFYNYGVTKITPLWNPLDPDVPMTAIEDAPISDELRSTITTQTIDRTERKGFNLSNVRIDGLKNPKAKPFPWDISNFSVTYAYNEIFRRNVNIEHSYIKQYRGALQYAYTIRNPLTLKPFTGVKLFKNKWFALIRDFNLQLLPNSFGMSMDVNRNYTALKNRDITGYYQGAEGFENPTLINKNFTMTRNYNFVWAFNKSLKFDYMATNDGRILEPSGEVWKDGKNVAATNSEKYMRDKVLNTFFNGQKDSLGHLQGRFGENTIYRQQMNLNADAPLNKIPILDFMKAQYTYGGTYTWTRRPFAANDSIGNTIQNTRSHKFTCDLRMMTLYNKIPYFRRINNPSPMAKSAALSTASKGIDAKGGRIDQKDTASKPNNFKEIGEFLARFVMMIKSVNVTYNVTGGQALPNFLPSSQYIGLANNGAPGLLFTTGLYDPNIKENAARNNWLSKYQSATTPYVETEGRTLNYRTNVEPHGSFKIELTGNYSLTKNKSAYIRYDKDQTSNENRGYFFDGSPLENGTFNISTFTFFNSFKDGSDPVKSNLFNAFLEERGNIARELSAKNDSSNKSITTHYDGYSLNQQDVLVGAFYRTYTGRDIKDYSTKNVFPKVPLPNWNITWDGLGKLPAAKKLFSSIQVRHAYRSSYNISGFTNNLLFNPNGTTQDQRMPVAQTIGTLQVRPNFVPYYSIASVMMRESYEPLIKFDFRFNKPGWSANVETRRDKTTTLNLTGFQIVETKGQEYIVGIGYMIPKLRLNAFKIQGKTLESNLNIKLDLSFRKNVSVIRQIETEISTPTGGTNIITLRSSADYQLTQNVMLRLFYDWIRTTPQTSASFPTSSINAGFSLRITFQ
ncbi:MAG: cell surface protein SprA, partial [Bacteroidia bacterium]|nr:cell surface protein SprA [Bacteroidia bacterium]